MKPRFVSVVALSLALSQIAAVSAFADQAATQVAASHFRSVAPQTFSAGELQAYGLDADSADKVSSLQDQGYQVVVLSPEEAQQYSAGQWSTQTWLIIGLVVVVVAVAASSSD